MIFRQQMHGLVPLRSTPMAVILERAMENFNNQEFKSATSEHHNGHAIQIITDRGIFSCLTKEGTPFDISDRLIFVDAF